MTRLKYIPFPNGDADRLEFIRRTRTVCIHASNRPKGIYSKSLVRVVVSYDDGSRHRVEGVFCVDAFGSKMGHLVGHESHFKGIAQGSEVVVEITQATPQDCVEWLEGNDDPERKSLGQILNFALQGTEETKRLAAISEENFKAAKDDRLVAAQDKKRNLVRYCRFHWWYNFRCGNARRKTRNQNSLGGHFGPVRTDPFGNRRGF